MNRFRSSPLPGPDVAQSREEGGEGAAMPCTEDVICKTEQITKNIQELLRAAQETKHERYIEMKRVARWGKPPV